MRHVIYLILLLFLLIFTPKRNVFGETSTVLLTQVQGDNKTLRADLDKQRALVRRLRARNQEEIRRMVEDILDEREEEKQLSELFSDGGLENMIFHGYVDLEWKSTGFDQTQGGTRGHHFFDNHHFNLWFGYRITDNLIAKSEIEIEHGGESFGMEFATLEWKPFSSDLLEFVMGMILVPLGAESPVHASVRNKLISRPLPSLSIIPGTYGDIGIEARGWYPSLSEAKFRYHFYVVNGIGDHDEDQIYEQNALKASRDNNGNKAVGTQFAIFPMSGLELGVSGYFGKWDDQDRNQTHILASHVLYHLDQVEIRTEYAFQKIEEAGGPGSGDATLQGLYFQGASRLSSLGESPVFNMLELVTRYDWLRNEDGVRDLKQGTIPKGEFEQRFAVGLNFRPMGKLQFKMEYMYRDHKGSGNDRGLALQAVANW